MSFISTAQAAKKWGISPTRITILAKNGRIDGAVQIGSRWMIPENAKKPIDGRTKAVKSNSANHTGFFRYPNFIGREIEGFNPPLSQEEIIIKKALEFAHDCRFEEAEAALGNLYETSENLYNRIFALYLTCHINFLLDKTDRFLEHYGELASELQKEFPRKKELSCLIHELDTTLGMSNYFVNEFEVDSAYSYHESYSSHLASLCVIALYCSNVPHLTQNDINGFEFICSSFDDKCCYLDSQTMHFYLGVVYGKTGNFKKMEYHYRKALLLTEKYNLFWSAAVLYYYYGNSIDAVLPEFSEDFAKRIRFLSEDIHGRYSRFSHSVSVNNIFSLLPSKDYVYVFCAIQGYSNKEIARLLDVSQTYVGNRYSVIYETLGIKNKKELIDFYHHSINSSFLKNIKLNKSEL